MRAFAERDLEGAAVVLAVMANDIDTQWLRYKTTCVTGALPDTAHAREWFLVLDARVPTPGADECRAGLAALQNVASSWDGQLGIVLGAARRCDVLPGQVRRDAGAPPHRPVTKTACSAGKEPAEQAVEVVHAVLAPHGVPARVVGRGAQAALDGLADLDVFVLDLVAEGDRRARPLLAGRGVRRRRKYHSKIVERALGPERERSRFVGRLSG